MNQAKRKQILDAIENVNCPPGTPGGVMMEQVLLDNPDITRPELWRVLMENLERQGRIKRTGEYRNGQPVFVSTKLDH